MHSGLFIALWLAGCGTDSAKYEPIGGALTVSGRVVDFKTGSDVTGAVTVSAAGLDPLPVISVQGAAFTMTDVPDNSAFQIIASAPPAYRATYSPTTVIATSDLGGVQALSVAESYLGTLASGFGITPSGGNGIVLLHLVNSVGAAQAGVSGSNLVLAGASGASGPHFLDANMSPSTATSSSASGWVVFFEVPAGAMSLGQAANATVTLQMATSPVAAATVTIADVVVTNGAPPPLPTNVSFSNQVVPIFTNRGCSQCHSGGGIGKNLGNLALDGGVNHVYMQLTDPAYPARVNLAMPEKSKVLTMPSYENPPDAHPNVTFTGPQDPDYLKILVWIREGAKSN